MEWLNALGDFISRVGFPIAAAVAMFLQNRSYEKTVREMAEQNAEQNKSFEKSIEELRDAITDMRDAIRANKKEG